MDSRSLLIDYAGEGGIEKILHLKAGTQVVIQGNAYISSVVAKGVPAIVYNIFGAQLLIKQLGIQLHTQGMGVLFQYL